MQERRVIRRTLRDLQRQMRENPDEFLQADPKALLNYLNQSDKIIRDVKQTNEAAIDSRGLVIAADLSARRVQRLTSGNVGNGIDVDEFVSKCITFMLQGRGIEDDAAEELSSTQRRRRQVPAAVAAPGALGSDDEDEVGDEGDMMNWSHLGRFAAVPSVRRPAVTGFMLGPLSIEKKARRMTKRSAPFKVSNLKEVRPEELRAGDLNKSDKNDLPALCKKIYVSLELAQREAQDDVDNDLPEDFTEEQLTAAMSRYSLRRNGGIDLLHFVINPHSFGQTVENMFYVSFLIREGSVKLEFDKDGFPELQPADRNLTSGMARSKHSTTRHQSIMSIDMKTWRDIIDAFGITEPMIPHREKEHQQGPGARGWYS
ncbi:Nse4 C-terminal-domain-containing protein [Lasiosphaeria miniovina]|uniref:Non-structural maintenance of chromosomes element 4 n=1 Tax=Lasiosphaeria miniovina TaxID=1954250 RepID=A0AA40DHB1_9PEZI|nr:Nse4 C-terminal-domain-containing protein [Lasiosphaeria miniovina]KAK0703534.1 Nse4 C-terminal-domain-containing protein [Lasiosphaeria miniovina]